MSLFFPMKESRFVNSCKVRNDISIWWWTARLIPILGRKSLGVTLISVSWELLTLIFSSVSMVRVVRMLPCSFSLYSGLFSKFIVCSRFEPRAFFLSEIQSWTVHHGPFWKDWLSLLRGLHIISAKSIIIQDNSNGRRIRKTGMCTKLGKIDHNRTTLPSQTNK